MELDNVEVNGKGRKEQQNMKEKMQRKITKEAYMSGRDIQRAEAMRKCRAITEQHAFDKSIHRMDELLKDKVNKIYKLMPIMKPFDFLLDRSYLDDSLLVFIRAL